MDAWSWDKLKEIDGFGVPVKMFIHRKVKGKTLQLSSYGTAFGGALTLLYYIIMGSYMTHLLVKMNSGIEDITVTQKFPNTFSGSHERLDLSAFNFLPFIEVLEN